MTLNNAMEECKQRYYHGDAVRCVHGGLASSTVYLVNADTFRITNDRIVCDDIHLSTPYIVLYNQVSDMFAPIHMASSDPRVKAMIEEPVKKAPHRMDMIQQVVQLAGQLDKYDKIGGILGSLQRERPETLLDIQLRNFRERKEV